MENKMVEIKKNKNVQFLNQRATAKAVKLRAGCCLFANKERNEEKND